MDQLGGRAEGVHMYSLTALEQDEMIYRNCPCAIIKIKSHIVLSFFTFFLFWPQKEEFSTSY